MQTFEVKRCEGVEFPPPPSGPGRVHGLRAPGRIVMVVQEGSGWVLRPGGGREDVAAMSVVIWDTGDWVEYGSTGDDVFKTESYWSADLSEEEWKAVFAEAFGDQALG